MSQPLSVNAQVSHSEYHIGLMAHFHCQTRIQIRTRIPNPMATGYYAAHVSIARTQTQIQIPFPNGYCTNFRDRSVSLLHTFQSGDQSPNPNQWRNPA